MSYLRDNQVPQFLLLKLFIDVRSIVINSKTTVNTAMKMDWARASIVIDRFDRLVSNNVRDLQRHHRCIIQVSDID